MKHSSNPDPEINIYDLLYQWSELSPKECQLVPAEIDRGVGDLFRFRIFTRAVGRPYTKNEEDNIYIEATVNTDMALIVSAVMYYATLRGLNVLTAKQCWSNDSVLTSRAKVGSVTLSSVINSSNPSLKSTLDQPASILRSQAFCILYAYLDALINETEN